ncbi:MAG: hypothetical protein D6731_10490 [Planctomycetota bacterium]|nr:MAG: hypothetical protein D6731_10490 [Planctomycetota bacterium]
MPTYYVGEGDEHLVDHPPLFACREHKKMLRLSARFVTELIAAGQDIMPGNPQEIAGSFLPPAETAYRLPEFLLPPKLTLYNPRGLRGAEALPYAIVLVDKRFFGIPARYLSPDRFDGCEECRKRRRRPPRGAPSRRGESGRAPAVRRAGPAGSGRRPPPGPGTSGRPPRRPPPRGPRG